MLRFVGFSDNTSFVLLGFRNSEYSTTLKYYSATFCFRGLIKLVSKVGLVYIKNKCMNLFGMSEFDNHTYETKHEMYVLQKQGEFLSISSL